MSILLGCTFSNLVTISIRTLYIGCDNLMATTHNILDRIPHILGTGYGATYLHRPAAQLLPLPAQLLQRYRAGTFFTSMIFLSVIALCALCTVMPVLDNCTNIIRYNGMIFYLLLIANISHMFKPNVCRQGSVLYIIYLSFEWVSGDYL